MVRYQDIADTFRSGVPWKELRPMSQKLEFVEKATADGANVAALCREYGISRQAGHKWLRRFRAQGHLGLVERSRRPSSAPLATGEEIVLGILELEDRHPSFGPKKISLVLARKLGAFMPSRSTIARVLRRLGKVRKRRPVVRIWSVDGRPRIEVKAPNDLWTIDFKGWWRARDRDRSEPLTVRDAFSRKVLAVVPVTSTKALHVRRVLERLFRRRGLPLPLSSRRRGALHRGSPSPEGLPGTTELRQNEACGHGRQGARAARHSGGRRCALSCCSPAVTHPCG